MKKIKKDKKKETNENVLVNDRYGKKNPTGQKGNEYELMLSSHRLHA